MLTSRTVLFDATCKLCTSWVKFLKRRDPGDLQFISVQSAEGQRLLALHGYPTDRFETLVYLKGESVFDKSEALIAILIALGGFWRAAVLVSLIPAPVRNYLYLKLASNRYRVFGKVEDCHCGVPNNSVTPSL